MKPSAVERAATEAEAAHKAAYPEETPPVETPPVETPPVETPPEGTPPVEAVVTPDDATPPADDDKENTVDYWKHKYQTLQGMFNAEVPRLNAQIDASATEITNLQGIIATMETPPPAPVPQAQLSEEEIEEFGPDMAEFAKKAAMEALGPELQALRDRNQQLEQQNLQFQQTMGTVQANAGRDARQHVFDELSKAVPNWVQINESSEFIDWLTGVDTFSGETKQALVNQAFEGNDAPRVVAFFKKYVDEANMVSGQAGNQQTDTLSPTVNMDTLVAPGRPQQNAAVAADAGTEKPVYSAADITQFYADVQRGVYTNNPDEKQRIEADIVAAGREGRVVQ